MQTRRILPGLSDYLPQKRGRRPTPEVGDNSACPAGTGRGGADPKNRIAKGGNESIHTRRRRSGQGSILLLEDKKAYPIYDILRVNHTYRKTISLKPSARSMNHVKAVDLKYLSEIN